MSHRVTVQTEIKDKGIASAALRAQGYSFTESGNSLRITSGELNRATIDLSTGAISGDSDYHTSAKLGLLRQAYGEEKFKAEAFKQGFSIESRTEEVIDGQKCVRLRCRTALPLPGAGLDLRRSLRARPPLWGRAFLNFETSDCLGNPPRGPV
jgi:hypothetical protein